MLQNENYLIVTIHFFCRLVVRREWRTFFASEIKLCYINLRKETRKSIHKKKITGATLTRLDLELVMTRENGSLKLCATLIKSKKALMCVLLEFLIHMGSVETIKFFSSNMLNIVSFQL